MTNGERDRTEEAGRVGQVVTADRSVEEFLSDVASSQVAPSAGAVAAVTGALGASLCEMVCVHTPTAETSARLVDARAELTALGGRLVELAAEDAAAIEAVETAFEPSGGSGTDHEQRALRRATEGPVEIAETAREVADVAPVVAAAGTPNARPDAVVGAHLARAAVVSAGEIVRANLGLVTEEALVADARDRVETAERAADAAVTGVGGGPED